MIQAFAFYLFSGVMILSALLTITARNPVHSVLWLILAFFNAAGLMLLLGAEFIAMLLVIVYVGAVAVLFLFVVMMLDIDFAELRAGFTRYLGFGSVVAVALLAEIIIAVTVRGSGPVALSSRPMAATSVSNIQALGQLLYTRYLYIFEAAGLVLLVAMIGAIVLTHRERKDYKAQKPGLQVLRRPEDATRNVNQPVGVGVEL
ncbi:NADH-quinone oxidoreductase subunit J [Sphingomonas sp. ID1715]|uniref:NADH-quinone oxidoreductase subunit J n=1 Tax=Sphingomonas sp. ID1715 TaxID=1656898 RepID=UPI0014898BB8|nr:NADH-quinone oxidoreductase subunit J [Sphingomonas sp. ID1715]NNM75436.1 NADH-quinone oxidoreductase subunit J [Sphingomonas sp. ID1715]